MVILIFTKPTYGQTLHFDVSSLGTSKWIFLLFQSICRLCKMNHNNPMLMGFVGNEMTLKAILLQCDPMVISNALVLCITNFKEKLQPSITSIAINMVFFTRGSLSCHTKSLSVKHANALKSSTTLIFIVIDLLHLIVIGKKTRCWV
jgi:hypothetical protein